uniref:ZP domain-containing protein n=1 Tax=Cynoglossus semilaevis TaxID=244447 RepID=A0A3P8X133_CYNSE
MYIYFTCTHTQVLCLFFVLPHYFNLVKNNFLPDDPAFLPMPEFAAQCGFRFRTDPQGKNKFYGPIQHCFVENEVIKRNFLYWNEFGEVAFYGNGTCSYPKWSSREIICDPGFMEVSVKRAAPNDYDLPAQQLTKFGDPRRAAEPLGPEFHMVSMVFYTPEETIMKVAEAQERGYRIGNIGSRLVIRSSQTAPETYSKDVAGVSMNVLETTTVFEKKWLATRVNAAAACPKPEGKVCGNKKNSHSGQLSYLHNDQYSTSYIIEPMLELLWTEDVTEDTRYKVLFPIATPLKDQPPQVIDNTVPEERVFKVLLGYFLSDVALESITFGDEVLSIQDCRTRGFNVLEHISLNSSKVFTLEVPFTDRVVQQMKGTVSTVYTLALTFGLLVLPDYTPFSYSAYLEAKTEDIVPPSVSGGCDSANFFIFVKYGSPGFSFHTIVGKRALTRSLSQDYSFMENSTHLSLVVPSTAPDVAIEAVKSSSIKARLDVSLRKPGSYAVVEEFTLACNFPSALTECFPNGTMTALAVKLESVPNLNPSQLTLRDPSCGPNYSDDRYAFFVFTGNSCGTTRRFFQNVMLYENEISLPDELEVATQSKTEAIKISCYYDTNTTHAVAFNTRPRRSEPYAENANGGLQVAMRIASDDSYSTFYRPEDYPLAKYLSQPMYFEVELMRSLNSQVSLELENCWATQNEDRTSTPRWNLIINGCANPVDSSQVVFHPVWVDDRVQHPSLVKRFEVQMFAFAENKDHLNNRIYVHCDVVICDARNPLGGVCAGQCSQQAQGTKGKTLKILYYLTLKQAQGTKGKTLKILYYCIGCFFKVYFGML